MLVRLILFLCSIYYKKYNNNCKYPIFYIKGTGKDYPRYLLYDEAVYKRMDTF